MRYTLCLAELFNFNGHLVRQLIAQLAHHFFTHQLSGHKAQAFIGNLVFREEVDTFRQVFGHFLFQSIDLSAVLG